MINVIGLRTIKTGIAVTLSVIISNLLGLEYPFFVAMTAILSMDKTALHSYYMARNRVCGTFLGGIIGVALAYIDRGNPFLCGIGIMILIMILNRFKLSGAIGVSGIVMMAIMVHTKDGLFFYALNRTLDTIIGGCVSMLVNVTFLPYYNVDHFNQTLDKLWDQTLEITQGLSENMDLQIQDIHKNIDEINRELDLYQKEILFKRKDELVKKLKVHMGMLKEMMIDIDSLDALDKEKHPDVYEYHRQHALAVYNHYLEEQHHSVLSA